jgi:hypothetical protein
MSNNTGALNSALGGSALASNTTGLSNTAIGSNAIGGNTTGSSNVAVGQIALLGNTTGSSNTAVGQNALGNSTGSSNTALGADAGSFIASGTNNIDIRNIGNVSDSNTTRIGATQTRAFIAGIRGTTTDVGDAVPVLIDSAGQLGTASSSKRVKRDIQPLDELGSLMKLRPVSFRYRSGPAELHYGLIAEQVARVLPELAVNGDDGLPETVQYQELPTLLLAKIQDQQRQINRLMKEVRAR